MKRELFDNQEAGLCACFECKYPCVCSHVERMVRNYSLGKLTAPLSLEQRQELARDADWASEGDYTYIELMLMDDKQLCYATLDSWRMYVASMY